MSSLEKLHTGRGSMQGHRKFSDGFSDTSSGGSFMDDTDREVSNLTDRAFRSLCIGEEAIYNDSEFSSPTERHKAFGEEQQQKTVVQRSSKEECSNSVQKHGEAQSETASTFQHSYVDVSHQEQVFRAASLSYINNGSKEVTWQQGRSSSRVSSLIKAFSSAECYQDSGTCDVFLAKDKYGHGHESWENSSLLSIQRDLADFSSAYHQNFKSGPFQTYRNHFYSSDVATAVAQMDTTVMTKSSKSKFKSLNSTNSFFHSEFSPFQLWEEYNRFSFESMKVSGFMSANEFPRWYDSPMYKELKDTHRLPNYSQCENRRFNQRQTQDVTHSQHSKSTVIQKASAIEKRCESEMASNYLSWKKSNNFIKNKLPSNRPSTVSPTNEKTCRPDSCLFGNSKVIHEVQHKVENVVDSAQPSSVTPFNITQLLTPVIHTRQETETSEILQFAHTPAVSDYSSQGETDLKPLADAKHLRDSYKSRASSLLFNLKDNRKRVKSTYSPTKFKGLEITDRNKQPSKLEGRESRFSDILTPQETSQENVTGMDTWALSNQIQEPSVAPIKDYVDGTVPNDNLTSTSSHIQDGADNYKFFPGSSQGHFLSTDLLTNPESTQRELSSHNLSTQYKSSVNSEGQLKDLNSTVSPTRPEIANVLPKTHPSTRYLPTQTSEQQRYGPSQNDLKQRQDSVRKTYSQYSQNEIIKERSLWDQTGSVNSTGRETLSVDGRCETRPFGGEIAALIEMDKHRKAIAKQYLPSTNNGYSARKETYMQKVNEDIKLGRRAEEEEKEVKEDTISSRKTSYSGTSVHNNQLNTFSRATDLYGKKEHKTSSPPKDVHVYSGLQRYSEKNGLSERGPDPYSLSNSMPTQKTSDENALYVRSEENKSQNNDGLFPYQQYRYEANKQWHMTSASEDKHIKDNVWTHRQLEKTAHMLEHNGSKSYKISNMMSSTQQSTQHTTTRQNKSFKKDALSNPGLEDNGSVTENKPSRREDRFSINDILSIRDSEQAKKIKENTSAGDLDRSENKQNQIKHDTAEEKLTITAAIKEQGAQGYTVPDYVSPAPGYLKKDFSNANEGLANITTDRKDKLMSKNNDRVTTRALSYKEKGQSKQEILTSKLKAHAQKEISAIKEKGLAKQGIPARNTAKQSFSMTVNREIAQDGQEVNFAKKEITTDKLNHLFQDITYSSVTQHKELNKTHNDHSANGSPSGGYSQEDIQSIALDMKKSEGETQEKPLAPERQRDSLKYDKPPGEGKEEFTQNLQVGDDATVKNTKTIQMTDLTEKEPPKHHLIGNAEASSPTQYNNSEVVTTSNNISTIKMDEKSPTKTSIENQKANNSLNKTSQKSTNGRHGLLGLDRNEPNVEQATVHHKSGITAAVEQSKNELIKNSSAINISQLTSSSNDMKYKNGNPAAKLLTESDSYLQNTTMNADDERFRNRNYKQNSGLKSGVTPTLSLDNSATANDQFSSRSTKLEALENLDKDGENGFKQKQHKLSPVKVAESTPANKILESQSKSEPNKDTVQSLKRMVSEKAQESCQQKDDNTVFLLPVSKNEKHLENNNEQFKEVSRDERLPVSASHTDTKPTGTLYKEEPSMKESQKVTSEITGSPHCSKSPTKSNAFTQNTVMTGERTTQKNVDSTNDLTFSQLEPEEPMIFSICVSSKIENTSNDEPMIYTICVSSNSQNDKQQNPVKQDDTGSAETEPSAKDEKVKTDKAENNHDGNKSFGHSETEVPLKSKAEKEHVVRNREPPANTNKQDHHKPTEIGSIGTSYENLLAKYGLPVRNHGHLTPTHHMEDKKDMKEKEPEVDLSQKPMKHEMNRSLPSKEKSPDNTKIHPEDLRQTSDQQASASKLLKVNDNKIKQQANSSVKEKHCEIPLITPHPKHIGNAKKQDQDTKNEEKQSRKTGDVQLMDKKVEKQVSKTEKLQKLRKIEHITDNVSYSRKSPLKTEDVSVTAKQPAVISDSTNTAKTAKPINTKLNETITNANKNPQKVNTEDKMSETFLAQNTTTKDQKTEYCAKQDESVSAKDAQVLKNREKRDFEEKKPQPDKKQTGFNTHNEITNRMNTVSKDAADTHVNNYPGKVTSIGEDVCTVVKHDQTSFDAPKIHLNNIKVSTEEVSAKQELRVDHKSQHEVMKKESLRVMREAVVTENRADKDFTKQRNSPVKSPTVKNGPQILSNMKGTGEKTPKQKDDFEKGITPRKKDNPEQVQSLLRQVSEKGRREDSGILNPSGHLNKNDGDMKVNENSSSSRGKKERNDEYMKKQLTDRTNTNQHQSERGRPLETKENVSYEQGYSSQQGIKSEVKPEAAQRSKKVTRPEISALADYARLKVISAEEDKKEINILPKLDVHYSHDQSSTGLRNNSHGNVSGGEPKREAHNAKPLQFQERGNETFLSQKQNDSKPSTSTAQPKRNEGFDGKQEKVLTHVKDSNTSLTETTNREVRHKIYQSKNLQDSLPVQTEGRSGHSRSRQIAQEKVTEKENLSHSGRQNSQANLPHQAVSAAVKTEENQINMTSPAGEEMEELQYYTVNALDSDTKPKETSQASPSSHKITHNKDSVHKLEEEKKEDYRKDNVTGQGSNSSSPAMGKPIMFRVKDNTIRTTSVTKTVKPLFHRSFSDDLRIGSPTGHLSSSEKGDEKEPVSPSVLHEPATVAPHRLHKVEETQIQNNLPAAEHTAKQLKSHQRTSQNLNDEDDVENCTATTSAAHIPKIESYRDTYQRPASVCYDRPESSCYERPESACSDIRPLGKPPTVPPKSEKALRRAQKLTTRRMKKAESKVTSENQEELASNSITNVSSVPSSPSDTLSTHLAQVTPPFSSYGTEPNYTTPTQSMMAHPFTVTHRKLLQDPNSGQYFMVDMPLPVKTKTFYDPETGKYVQLNVRPRSQSAHSQPVPVEVLNGPYMLYPGFLPMAASSLPSVRSSSQMSTPGTLTNDQSDTGTDLQKQNQQKDSRQHPESVSGSREQIHDPSLNVQNNTSVSERHTDIITMSELEDFAMEST